MRALRGPHPALLVLFLAPYCGEGLSGSSPPLTLLVPWQLGFMVLLYGCGALLCREIAVRFRLGMVGLCLLAAAYGVLEEGLVDRYWFDHGFWHDSGIGDYIVVWHTNILLAVHLTVFHTAVSICLAVLVVEWLVPSRRGRPWVGRPGLVLAALGLASTPVLYGEFDKRPPAAVLAATGAVMVALIVAAFVIGRRPRRPRPDDARGRRGVGRIAFAATLAHWIATYAVPGTGLPWPVGVLIALVPVGLGVVGVVRLSASSPYGPDGVRAGLGIVWFFVLLDLFVGILGTYDLALSALLTAGAAWWLRRRLVPRPAAAHPGSSLIGRRCPRRGAGWLACRCRRRRCAPIA